MRKTSFEHQYFDLLRRVISDGEDRADRTGVGTRSLFGSQLDFDLTECFPLLTTKKMHWKSVVEELLWIISGSTNAKDLDAKGVTIWNANATREFLDARGLKTYPEGELGPVYGAQWRRWRGKIDQLQQAIDMIKKDPTSRRIVVTAWNPSDLPKSALPPCHMFYQFYVSDNGTSLSCHMYQRSADMGLGVPFNMASYALLTHMVAHVCGLKAKRLIMSFGDVHIYRDHLDAIKAQLKREPKIGPKIGIKKRADSIDDIGADDIELIGYESHPPIKMKMAV
jgi:thymidylate synthase